MGERTADGGGSGRRGRGGEFHRVRSSPTPPGGGGMVPPAPHVRRRRITLLLAGAMSVLVLLASGTAWAFTGWVSDRLNRSDVFGDMGDRPQAGPEGALNFLVIGSDSRSDVDGAGTAPGERADTMMLVHLNEDRDALTVVGIPRDSWVDVPGEGKDKINAAYSHGGPQLTVETVESATNVRIDHYIEVDFNGFVDVVDALGGIEVCLPEGITDEKADLDMAAGTHEVDGAEALAFARTRATAGGDLDRIDRQQQVMAALLDKALSSDTLSDPARFSAFLETALGTVTVDQGLDTETINRLGGRLRSIGLDDVAFTQVPIDDAAYWTPRGDVAVTWDAAAATDMFTRIAADEPLEGSGQREDGGNGDGAGGGSAEPAPVPSDVAVQVYNGIGTPGIGGKAAEALTEQGFAVPGTAQNWSTRDVETTTVRHHPDDAAQAKLVAQAFPGAQLQEDPTVRDQVQVVLGFDFTEVERVPQAESAGASPEPSGGGGESGGAVTARENVCG